MFTLWRSGFKVTSPHSLQEAPWHSWTVRLVQYIYMYYISEAFHSETSLPITPLSLLTLILSLSLSPISLFLIAPLFVILSLTLIVYVSIFLSLTLSPMSLPLGLSTSLTPIASDYVTYKTVLFSFYVHYLLPILSPTVNGFFNCCTLFSRYQIPIFAIFFLGAVLDKMTRVLIQSAKLLIEDVFMLYPSPR